MSTFVWSLSNVEDKNVLYFKVKSKIKFKLVHSENQEFLIEWFLHFHMSVPLERLHSSTRAVTVVASRLKEGMEGWWWWWRRMDGSDKRWYFHVLILFLLCDASARTISFHRFWCFLNVLNFFLAKRDSVFTCLNKKNVCLLSNMKPKLCWVWFVVVFLI